MIIKLIFDQSGGSGFAAFKTGVETAALMLEKAITNPITVTIEVGYGEFPTDHTAITGGAAEAEPNFDLVSSASFTNVVNHLSAGAAPGDTNFDTLTSIVMSGGTSITGSNGTSYNKVLLWSAEAKALGFPVSQGGVDGFAGFAKDINPNSLVGVALHELTHALGRAPYGLPAVNENDIPDIFDLFRFDSATNSPLVLDNGANAPPAYFTVNNGATISANYGETSDPSDFLNDSLTSGDPFDEFYDPSHPSSQSLTRLDLTQLDVLGFNTIAATFSWASGVNGDFASASNWTSGGESPPTSAPIFNDNVLITQGGVYTVSSFADQTINSLVMASGATLDIIGGVFTIENGTFFANTSGTIEVNAGATLVLDGEVDNAGTIEAVGGTIELLGTLTGSGASLISSGGTLIVAFGGVSDPVTIFSGGTEIVDSGGTDGGAQISGGEQDVFGSANGAIVFAGSQVIEAGGTASNTIVLSGGACLCSAAPPP
jgi:autotransporter passenger strand-loop-strand repeat protein